MTWARTHALGVAAFVGYAALDLLLRPSAGLGVGALGFLAVLLAGYVGGLRAGFVAGAVFPPLLVLLGLAAGASLGEFLAHNVAGMIVGAAIGPVAGWLGDAHRDLTARMRTLAEERAFAQHLVEDANALIVGVDADGRVRTFNRRAEEVLGLAKSEVIGTYWWEKVLPLAKYPQLAAKGATEPLDASEIPRVFEIPLVQADGEERLILWRISQIQKEGRFDGVIGYGTDVTPARATDLRTFAPVARAVVQEIVAALARSGAVGHAAERGVGRSIAAALPPGGLEEHVRAYHAMGLGRLHLEAASADRFHVVGEDLLEQRLKAPQPTCYIALGFLEGLGAAAFGADCLGAEIRCRSQGAPRCEFVVRARGAAPRTPEAAVAR